MFIGPKIIYIELQKTGSTHAKKLLSSVCEGESIGKHNAPDMYQQRSPNKIMVGNIRNPWDWYVSLWAFGCMKRGTLYKQVTKIDLKRIINNPKSIFTAMKWRSVYSDRSDPKTFQKWLKMIFSKDGAYHCKKEYGRSPISTFAGLLTFRYLRLYTSQFHKNRHAISNYNQLEKYDKKNNFIDHFLRTENLNNDLLNLMHDMQIPEDKIKKLSSTHMQKKTNRSKRKSYQHYYNDETIKLVQEREKFIIEKYNYSFQ